MTHQRKSKEPQYPQTLGSVLVTGADGGIARGLLAGLGGICNKIWSTTRCRATVASQCLFLDLSQASQHWSLPPTPLDVVFLCAAIGSQEQCRIEPLATRQVNVLHTVELAKRLASEGAFVVFISSNLVFDGQTAFAPIDHPCNPQTTYGQQKAEAEQQLLNLGTDVAIVRFGKVIVPGMSLFGNWISDLRSGKIIHPFDDMMMAPISLTFAVQVLCRLALRRRAGIVHATATHDISYADAARVIAQQLGADPDLIVPASHRNTEHVFAPLYSALNTTDLVELDLAAPTPHHAFDNFVKNA
jgi:dTDP-4-dehydrorhamnose reductase